MNEPKLLILVPFTDTCEQVEKNVRRVCDLFDCHKPFEVAEVRHFFQRWEGHDWQSEAFRKVFLRKYHKVTVWGGWLHEDDKAKYFELAGVLGWKPLPNKQVTP